MLPNIRYIDYLVTKTEEDAFLWENTLIKRFQPKYNILLKDDKTYPYMKITNEEYPCILITRRVENDGAEYFGPYVDVNTLKDVIRLIKKIFQIRKCRKKLSNTKKEKRPCLNYFMNKCLAPCCFDIDENQYKDLTRDIKMFVKLNYKDLIDKWSKEIEELTKDLKFEKAEIVKNRILAIQKLKDFKIKIWEISESDLQRLQQIAAAKEEEISQLENILEINKKINTIAGFDISNISGKYAVGSRVVFVNNVPDKSKYRRYKIKEVQIDKPNDFEMMRELIRRALKSEDIGKVDLLLIDGGKGHLNIACQEMERQNKNIPIISIAKKEEIIFTPNQKNGIKLDMSSESLKLIRYIRDEAHRFAVTYHRKLRAQKL